MSNELVKADTSYMSMYGEYNSVANYGDVEADADANALFPKVALKANTADDCSVQIILGGKVLASEPMLDLSLVASFGSRMLWDPDDGSRETKLPRCLTGLVSPMLMKRDQCQGQWLEEDGGRVPFNCLGCEYNEWESEGKWAPAKGEGRGKACKESRIYYALLLREHQQIGRDERRNPVYNYKIDRRFVIPNINPFGLVKVPVSMSSSRQAIVSVGTILTANQQRFPYKQCLALRFSGKGKAQGQNLYGYYEVMHSGLLVGKPEVEELAWALEAERWIHDQTRQGSFAQKEAHDKEEGVDF